MTTDLTFITNEQGQSLLERFKILLGSNTRYFDCLVGYFYSSGFYSLTSHFENTERIRILIGVGTDARTAETTAVIGEQLDLEFSHAETKEHFSENVVQEMTSAPDSLEVEQGVAKFIEWIRAGRLQIRAYPSGNLHAKVYILTFGEGDRDLGRVITGSSNFTRSGLQDNLEFNVELKNSADYRYAQAKFDELWEQGVDVSERFVETINTRTWLNADITPHEIYLKFLYEYFRKDLSHTEDISATYTPLGFRKLEYQEQAVVSAKRVLEEYGGVFLSDVVGLGKTYISAMLASQLDGRNLVIAPPVLLDKDNPGSWENVFTSFNVPAEFESIGKIEDLAKRGTEQFKNVFLDESHRHRTEGTQTYAFLKQICWGKRVILVSATPLNNTPNDIRSQVLLFQKGKKSTIPNLPDLDTFFRNLDRRLKQFNRRRDPERYREVVAENAKEVRERLLKYLMIRRTRTEVSKYFGDDLEKQGMRFPEIADPHRVFYQFDKDLDRTFSRTVQLIKSDALKYARYQPVLYLNEQVSQLEQQSQVNLGRFMKVLLIKRLDSSFHAFRNTVGRFISSYERFVDMFRRGYVFMGKGYVEKIFDLVEDDRFEEVDRLIDEGKAERHDSSEFSDQLLVDLENDLATFREIHRLWASVAADPKLDELVRILRTDILLCRQDTKVILFTESKETGEYLTKGITDKLGVQPLLFSGQSGESARFKVIENFDANFRDNKDDFRILITTDVLAEGVNLHRSNAVINYDIPWNPTRMMQRVGRVNRVDTKFDEIHTFNFFPTEQSNDEIRLEEAARAKIDAFIQMLGADAKLLTEDEEITSHDLFARLNSKKTIVGEDEGEQSELEYFQIIKDIRDNDIELFDRIKRLPKKARSARAFAETWSEVISYIRKRQLEKFYLASGEDRGVRELDFFQAAKCYEAAVSTPRATLGSDFYALLEANKNEFELATIEDLPSKQKRHATDNAERALRILKSNDVRLYKGFTEDDEEYIRLVIRLLEEGTLPPKVVKDLKDELEKVFEPPKILTVLKLNIAEEYFQDTPAEEKAAAYSPLEVILSEYLVPSSGK